MYKSHLLPHR